MMKIKSFALLLLSVFMLLNIVACSDDDVKENIYHQNYVEGEFNQSPILMNDINADVTSEKSYYSFKNIEGSDVPRIFDWEVKMVDMPDSVVTLFLHISDLRRTNCLVYSPNDGEPVQSDDTCCIKVKNNKTGDVTEYHPTHISPITAKWNAFIVTADDKYEKHDGLKFEYYGHQWPGIQGSLHGVFYSDDAPSKSVSLNLNFKLY